MKVLFNRCVRCISAVAGVVALSLLSSLAMAGSEVGIDGRLGIGEYSSFYNLNFQVQDKPDPTLDPVTGNPLIGKFYYRIDGDTVSMAFVQPKTLVDNSYGPESKDVDATHPDHRVGWGSETRTLDKLLGSDKAQIQFFSDTGGSNLVTDVTLDYLYYTNKNAELSGSGLEDGSATDIDKYDGKVDVGSAANILGAATSQDYNMKNFAGGPLDVTDKKLSTSPDTVGDTNSDSTDDDYVLAAGANGADNYAGWIFETIYEFKVSKEAFGMSSLAGLDLAKQLEIVVVHDSPNKVGGHKVWPEFPDGPTPTTSVIPEPLTMLGVLAGVGRRYWIR